MPRSRNYRFAQESDLQMATPSAFGTGVVIPTSPEAAESKAVADIAANPNQVIDNLIEQQRAISSNKQKLISSIIQPMKGLSDKPTSAGNVSPAEKYATDLLHEIEKQSSISEDAAVSMLLETWPTWQKNGNTWETFEDFIKVAASHFFNTQDVIEWSKKLFETMQDGAPVFTPEYIMQVALEAVKTGNFTNYQNLLLSMPFYKAIWSKQPVDTTAFSKATTQIGLMMQAIQTPTTEMGIAMDNMIARYNLLTNANKWYKGMLAHVTVHDTKILEEISRIMKNRRFTNSDDFEKIMQMQMQRYETEKIIRSGLTGLNVVNPQRPMERKNSNKFFKTSLATGPSGAGSGSPGSGSSGTLSPAEQAARTDANKITRLVTLVEKRKLIIENNVAQINNITEQKTKGLSGDLGLFSSLVTSGNVVKKIDETLKVMQLQFFEIDTIINLSKAWLIKHNPKPSDQDAREGIADTIRANEMTYQAQKQSLNELSQSLKIQKIVLPKELEYFELKQEYDTNVGQLKAPVSALMVNSLTTTTDNRGKTKTVNKRVARPLAIKNAWETGKKIVTLLMQISQALQAATGKGSMGESMAKNAASYYKAAIKQEVENNNMLMENLTKVGLGQVNYTPVAVGKK